MPQILSYHCHPLQSPSLANHLHVQWPTTPFFQRCLITNLRPIPSLHLSCPNRNPSIRCMANPRRVKMVAKQIRRELSEMLLTDKVIQYAVLPEAALGADRFLSSLTTISDVEVSADLQVVKVYVSVFGDERGKEVAISGLRSKAKYVRSELGKRMKLRLTPEIRFIEDDSIERGNRVIAILDKLKNEKSGSLIDDDQNELSNFPDEDPDWEGDDHDNDGIIYVK
ncbi:probable ribosome-binding factor A, chloroplastic [Impatiens glandulifera]|uniref:probable ribosome-binding factor A, chloroplastic n=1 Tax=Impatiens glandulifera TaxID=253017 RepID=UPI001FB1771E|nr:probable ribosome-binding factor A, chloroplastic [Impatiens glandulifera]XP_047321929.1 probable ribosome-binding factor A, chloroplastic [Impatiens glandulifera]